MKTKRFVSLILSLIFFLTLVSLPSLAAQEKAQKQPERVRIPKEIKEMLAQLRKMGPVQNLLEMLPGMKQQMKSVRVFGMAE